ncbi:hypothetical protein [Bacillus toyonensis]|uniref:hypothetical protein n=1 Tax=Bacillus toyonensis TaxID=155322 RepID=UPI00159BAF84|nr:hypothetical protein [Bacillus toyonensis]
MTGIGYICIAIFILASLTLIVTAYQKRKLEPVSLIVLGLVTFIFVMGYHSV